MSNLDHFVEQTLYFVAQKGWTRSREGFFTALVTFLGGQLLVEYALVDDLLPLSLEEQSQASADKVESPA